MSRNNEPRDILKTNEKSVTLNLKTAKFDEINLMETYHPSNKDYGHMIIDEPKTPFVFEDGVNRALDTEDLMKRLRCVQESQTPMFGFNDDSDDTEEEDFTETIDERVRRLVFERRRKLHYKEFMSVPLARRLIAEEFSDMTSSEVDMPCETEQSQNACESCIPESCPSMDVTSTTEGAEEEFPSGRISNYSDVSPPQEPIEPGFHPQHRCHQKLMAEIAKTEKPNLIDDASVMSVAQSTMQVNLQSAALPSSQNSPSKLVNGAAKTGKPKLVN